MSKRIVLTGPESSGKSTLAKRLSSHFKAEYVSEYARAYINRLGRSYDVSDLAPIASGQRRWEKAATYLDNDLIIQDTDLLTILIWYEHKYKIHSKEVKNDLEKLLPNLYLLCKPDIPWTYDPQRENPNDRGILFEKYLSTIQDLEVPYLIVEGEDENRYNSSVAAIAEIL